eukprot:gene94-97_t
MLIPHKPPNIFEPIGPYAQAIEAPSVKRLLFISGTMGLEPDGTLIKDFATQANRVWENIDATLASAGMERKNLAKLTIWLANHDDWKLGAEIRQSGALDRKAHAARNVISFEPNAFIRIDPNNTVTLTMARVEMGQGIYTSLAMLIAEELEVPLSQVKLEHAPPDAALMLVSAAAHEWGVVPSECHAKDGHVIHGATGRRLSYGELSQRAAGHVPPKQVTLKPAKDFKLVGKPVARLDAAGKVNGSATYGIDVRIHNHLIGGGFGRRLEADYVEQSVALAKNVEGPVQPLYVDQLSAALDEKGRPTAITHRVVGSSIIARVAPGLFRNGVDSDAVEAGLGPYNWPAAKLEYVRHEPMPGLVTGWWRGAGARRGRGVSVLSAFGSHLGQVAEVTVNADGEIRVDRVVCAVDCGMVVNPNTVQAQIDGGVLFGVTAALWGEITIKDGRVEQSNFHNYRLLRLSEAPRVEVHIVPSQEVPGGVGEPGTSAVIAAIANAVHAAVGERPRSLPVRITA